MISVNVKKQSYYPVNTPKLKKKLIKIFADLGIVSDAQVSVSFVGKAKMQDLSKTYLKEKGTFHSVLAFPVTDETDRFKYPPNIPMQLGDIVICYPQVQEEAGEEGKLVDDKIYELLEHGAMHLMGIHHN